MAPKGVGKTAALAVPSRVGRVDPLELAAWLKEQAAKLQTLGVESNRLKIDFVQNAKMQGEILIEVRERLVGGTQSFHQWVKSSTDIGYSTALFWVDVAKHYEAVKQRFTDSNPLESLRQFRGAIRDVRHEQGTGKPGSGRKQKATAPPSHASVEQNHADNVKSNSSKTAATGKRKVTASRIPRTDAQRWEQAVAVAEAEAEATTQETGVKIKATTHYKVTLMVFSDKDKSVNEQALSNWSPVSRPLPNRQHAHTLMVVADLDGIGELLTKLGKILEDTKPEQVKVSVER